MCGEGFVCVVGTCNCYSILSLSFFFLFRVFIVTSNECLVLGYDRT